MKTKKIEYEVSYVDTCLSDYLTDHHNREGEILVGIPLVGHGGKRQAEDEKTALDFFLDEVSLREDAPRKNEAQLSSAVKLALKGIDFRPVDEDGNRVGGDSDEAWNKAILAGESQVWFVLKWEE